MKVLVATEKPFAKVAVDGIREVIEQAGYELALLEKYTDKRQLLDAVADADALIIRSDIVDSEVLNAAKQLKIVVRAGAGYDNIDLAAATAHKVVAMNTPGQGTAADIIKLAMVRVDEALRTVSYFMDDAIQLEQSRVRILHGTGTGALRELVRNYLATVPGVKSFRDEHVQFGGAGITVVELE